MRRLPPLLFGLCLIVSAPVGGCASGEVDAELAMYLSSGNLDYYEDVLFPGSRRAEYDAIFGRVPLYLPLHLPYESTSADAIITQRGDLQITTHLTAGQIFAEDVDEDRWRYLEEEPWNGESDEDRWGEEYYDELARRDRDYRKLDEDLRLILLVNLPAPPDDGPWDAGEWEYPVELHANYLDTYLDEQEQEHPIPEDEIELMSRMIIGGEQFETLNNTRLDEETGASLEDPAPNLILDELEMPQGTTRGRATGTFDLMLEANSFGASSGIAVIEGSFEVEIRDDPWALEDLDVREDLGEQ